LLYMSVRFKHSFACEFKYTWMPFDEQPCPIELMSYTEDASQVMLAAKDGVAIELGKKVHLPSWRLTNEKHSFDMSEYGTGADARDWHSMSMPLLLDRVSGYHVWNDVFYAVLFVLMSWSGFFVNRKNAPARVTLSLLPVLTMLNHIRGVQQDLPRSSDVTWLSAFLVISLIYNIIAVLEYGLVSYQMGLEDKRAQRLVVLRELSKHLDQAHRSQRSARVSSSRIKQSQPSDPRLGKFEDVDDIPSAEEAEEGDALSHAGGGSEEGRKPPPAPKIQATESASRADTGFSIEQPVSFGSDFDETDLMPMQKRMVEDSMKLFDTHADGMITRRELRNGLRMFDIYYTAEQVLELFGKMCVKEKEDMPRAKFLHYLASMPAPSPTMDQSWIDQPPSAMVDRTFRYCYFASYGIVILIMLIVNWARG